jgi:DNA-binding Lrp family transcriptional regulator
MRLNQRGILTGYALWVDPSLFGRSEVILGFEGERTRDEALRFLHLADVTHVGWKVDGGVTIMSCTADEERGRARIVDALGEIPIVDFRTARRQLPPLSRLDAVIVDALADDPAIPFKELVDATGLTAKTVRRHLKALIDSQSIIILPKFGVQPHSGELVFHLSVVGDVSLASVTRIVPGAIVYHRTHRPPSLFLLCRTAGLAEFTRAIKEVERIPGVTFARANTNRELMYNPKLIHRLIRGGIAELDKVAR